jgi:hypothetical protein
MISLHTIAGYGPPGFLRMLSHMLLPRRTVRQLVESTMERTAARHGVSRVVCKTIMRQLLDLFRSFFILFFHGQLLHLLLSLAHSLFRLCMQVVDHVIDVAQLCRLAQQNCLRRSPEVPCPHSRLNVL